MKVSLNWLQDFVALSGDPEKIGEKITEVGFPVEGLARLGVTAQGIVSVKILSVDKHPNADRLRLATVTDGQKQETVVCGAPNIAAGQIVPLATLGAKLPDGTEITASKIRGVESRGMLCSERELGLSENHEGILQLPPETPLGKDIRHVLGDDVIYDLDVPPNRPDALSHVGIARDLAASLGSPLKRPKTVWKTGKGPCDIRIDEPSLCFRYLGKVFTNVRVGPSPDWMAARLKNCGIRPINNVVDITNYVLLEYGHPLHAFDLSKLAGRKIIVRRAQNGEAMKALDEREYKLGTDDLVIADDRRAMAIAGIMGGQDSGVETGTTEILLESAVFDRLTVRKTSRRLGLKSESSLRFEKGTDTVTAEQASLRAAQLLMELAGAQPGGSADVFPTQPKPRTVSFRPESVQKLAGLDLKPQAIKSYLERLEFETAAGKSAWRCTVPAHRKDVTEEADLVEDIIRMVGYGQVPVSHPSSALGAVPSELAAVDAGPVADILKGAGFNETISSSFTSAALAAQFGVAEGATVALANPLSQEESILRPLLVPELLRAVQRNINVQRESVLLFEVGKRYRKGGDGRPVEQLVLAFVAHGPFQRRDWQSSGKNADLFFAKGLMDLLNERLAWDLSWKADSSSAFLHPKQSFDIRRGVDVIGWYGVLHPSLSPGFDLKHPAVAGEFVLPSLISRPVVVADLSRFPAVERDIAVVVPAETSWETLRTWAERGARDLLKGVTPFDIFAGGSIEAGKKSVAFRVRLQHPEHTLSDAEITAAVEKIRSLLKENCGAQLR